MGSLSNEAAIVGIGATEFSKDSGRSELRLAAEAITAALDDAGIAPHEVDGLSTFAMDNNSHTAVARTLGIPRLSFMPLTPAGGGGGCATVALAAAAVTTGLAEVVVCYRAMNERSQQRFGQPKRAGWGGGPATTHELDQSWVLPYGLATAAGWMALVARRYMVEYGLTSEDFGRVTVGSRAYAATNPQAWFHERPITLEDHQASRLVTDPLRLLDCCQESDGAVALVVTSTERAKDLRRPPAVIAAAAQGIGADQVGMATPYRADLTIAPETAIVGEQLWAQSGLKPADVDLGIIYDHFSFAVLMQLEALGFCKPGEAAAFVAAGETDPGGSLPVNTNGGQVGEAYIHGFNGIAEAVRQLRGTAVNQVADTRVAVVTSGSHVPTSGLVLTSTEVPGS
ncbi:lipid-transfer protein [Pseudonocardia sp. GCM10023141]|uniref:lipid-transfer protein n=1 Tax=Pseudonocardia sp. GCM10023141 TaxID=3252653 RepID=UPI00361F5E00